MRSIEFELNLTYRIGISTGIVPCVWFAYVRAYWWCTSKRRGWSEPIAVEHIWLQTGRGIHLLRRNHDERDCLHLVSCYQSINQSIKMIRDTYSTQTGLLCSNLPAAVIMIVRVSTLFRWRNTVHQIIGTLTPHFGQHVLQCRFITVQIIGDQFPVTKHTHTHTQIPIELRSSMKKMKWNNGRMGCYYYLRRVVADIEADAFREEIAIRLNDFRTLGVGERHGRRNGREIGRCRIEIGICRVASRDRTAQRWSYG